MPTTATYGPTAAAPAAGPPSALSGKPTEATIDQVNIWMRGQPWYQAYMRSIGQDPGHPTLTENQSTAVKRLAQANGVVVDEGNIELDDHGNFNPIGHKLRNTLIVIGAAAATIATMGAAGAFSGAAAPAAAEGGALASTATVPSVGSLVAGGTGLAAGAGAVAAPTIAGAGAAYGATAGGGLASNLLKYGAPVAGGIVGDLIQANASGKASDAQQAYLQEALDYTKQEDALNRTIAADKVKLEAGRYANYSGNVAPYLATGNAAAGKAASLLGVSPPPQSTAQPPASMSAAAGPAAAPASASEPTVTVQAPTGETQAVPQSQLSFWVGKGAKQVSA